MKKYRYISCGAACLDDTVDMFRLISSAGLRWLSHTFEVLRIEIPDDMEIEFDKTGGYWTTEDHRTLRELNPMPMIYCNGRMKAMPKLLEIRVGEWYKELITKYHMQCFPKVGYLNRKQAKAYTKRLQQGGLNEYLEKGIQ